MATRVVEGESENGPRLSNSMILKNFQSKLEHLSSKQQVDMKQPLLKFQGVFGYVPSVTTCSNHDVNVGKVAPIQQHPYPMNPTKLEQMRKEVDYVLQHHKVTVIGVVRVFWSPRRMVPSNSALTSASSMVLQKQIHSHFQESITALTELAR